MTIPRLLPTLLPTLSPALPPSVNTVAYDGECPWCKREIAFYKKLDAKAQYRWLNIRTQPLSLRRLGIDPYDALAELHVVDKQGQLHSGLQAHIHLWASLPGYCHLARLLQKYPAMAWVSHCTYRVFARVRPYFQRLSRLAKKTASTLKRGR